MVGRDLLPDTAHAIGRGYAAVLAERGLRGAVAVGRDNRPSGEALQAELVAGLTASGVDVVELGVVPTPLLYWALHHEPVVGGIQITGSHNPPEYNGFKLCVGHESLHGDEIQHVLALIQRGAFATGRGAIRSAAVIERYVDNVVARIGPLARRLRVVFDCGNGAGSLVAGRLFGRLGMDAVICSARAMAPFPTTIPIRPSSRI